MTDPDPRPVEGGAGLEGPAEGPGERPGPGPGGQAERQRRRWILRGGLAVLATALALALGVARTAPGQQLLLDLLLRGIQGTLSGTFAIERLESGNVLAGATLSGVELADPEGRPVARADSAMIRYRPISLLFGRPRFRSITLWNLELTIRTAPEGGTNLERALARPGERAARPDSAGAALPIELGRVQVQGGVVAVRSGEAPPPDSLSTAPQTPREITLSELELDLREAVLDLRGPERFRAALAGFTSTVALPGAEGPLRIRDVEGDVGFGTEGIQVTEATIRLPGTALQGEVSIGPERASEPWVFGARLTVEGWGALGDLRWVDGRVPDGRFRGSATLRADPALTMQVEGLEVEVEGSALRASGEVAVGPAFDFTEFVVLADPLELSRIEPWWGREVPFDGTLRGRMAFEGRFVLPDTLGDPGIAAAHDLEVALSHLEVEVEGSTLDLDGRVGLDPTLSLRGLVVTASPLRIEHLEPLLGRALPLEGFLSGRATLTGPLAALSSDGRVSIVASGGSGVPSIADFNGILHLDDDPGATDLALRLDPFDYALLDPFLLEASALSGTGEATIDLSGRRSDGFSLVAEMTHGADSVATSRVFVRGRVVPGEVSRWTVQLRGDLAPLSLGSLNGVRPDLGLEGAVEGEFRADGPMDALQLVAEVRSGEGSLSLNATADLLRPGSFLRVEAEGSDFPFATLSSRIPERSRWTGALSLEGRALPVDSIEGRVSLTASASQVGGLDVDDLTASVRAEDGILHVDTFDALLGGVSVVASGGVGLREGREAEVEIRFDGPSLSGLQPWLMGDSLLVADGLSQLDQELLRLQGIDPDTLPSGEEVRVAGSARGEITVRGWTQEFALALRAELVGGVYGTSEADSAHLTASVSGLPSTQGAWEVALDGLGVRWQGRSFDRVAFDGTMRGLRGDGALELDRGGSEEYRMHGQFELAADSGVVRLTEASARLDEQRWELARPALVAWTESSVEVEDLEISRVGARPGEPPMRIAAAGTLAWGAPSDFRLDVEGVQLGRLARVAQVEDLDVAGEMELTVTVLGAAEAPVIDAFLRIDKPALGSLALSRINGSLEYRERNARVRLDVLDGRRAALRVSGTVPIDLALADIEGRRLPEPMDVRVTADSLDARIALAYFTLLEDVTGSVSGDVSVRGSSIEPRPEGSVVLENAAWTLEALEVRHTGVSGSLTLSPDRVVDVALVASGPGRSTVRGTLDFASITNPELGLDVEFSRFLAMQRRDMEGFVSGRFSLGGSYNRPVVEGALRVDEGTIYVDEFTRAVGVVDLTDPRLFGQGLPIDTTVFLSQPLIAAVRNPFLENLRVDIDLSVPRDTWLRSDEMNVEMGGDLLMRYDRSAGDFVLVGELQALRGTYLVLGRTFEVDQGTVSFMGLPGVNPTLDLQASTRIRRREQGALEVSANVEGTLLQPRVTFTSDEPGLSQSDMMSYLVFGQATGELASDQQSVFTTGGALGTGASAALGGGITWYTGALANQFGSAIARRFGLDYLAVSSLPAAGQSTLTGGSFQNTQLEFGRYVGDDVFVVLVLRPVTDGTVDRVGSVRVEWAMTQDYNVEAFVEDRLLRSGAPGLGIAGLEGGRILGVFLFREWGYD